MMPTATLATATLATADPGPLLAAGLLTLTCLLLFRMLK